MKKKLLFTGLLLTTLLVGTYVNAEERKNTDIGVVKTEKTQSASEFNIETAKSEAISKIKDMYNSQMIPEEEMNNFLNRLNQAIEVDDIEVIVKEADTIISKNFLEMTKNDISFNIKKMYEDKLLTEKEMNDLLNRLSQVTTREDAEAILDEAKKISDNYFLEMIKNDISFNIKKMYEDKLLTEKEMNDLLNRLSQVTTREEAEAILDEAKKISDNYFLEMTKNDISFNIKKMYEDKLLTEKEMNDFLNRLSQVTTREEAEAILSEAKKLSDSKELTKGAFADKYINIKTQIELLIKNGDLTKEQGSSFLEKVEKAKTVEELDTIWQEVEKQVETNKKATTSSTEKETKKDSKTTNQLPKTGESKINIGLVSIGFVLILSFVVIIFKSRKFNN